MDPDQTFGGLGGAGGFGGFGGARSGEGQATYTFKGDSAFKMFEEFVSVFPKFPVGFLLR
jgi:hypothetical protein